MTTLDWDFYGFQNELTDRENGSIDDIRAFFETEVRPIANEYWQRGEFPHHLVPGIAALGLFGPEWPETRRFQSSAVYQGWCALEMARVDPSVCGFAAVQSGLAMGSIGVGGSPAQRSEWLPRMATGELIGAFALTEPLSGSDSARGLRTTASRTADGWVLNGSKRWIGNGTIADVVIVYARDTADGQVKGFVVPTSTPGFTATKIEGKQSFRLIQNADIELAEVRLGDELRLPGIRSFDDTAVVLRLTRAGVGWLAVGNAIGAYEAALAYTKTRQQFGAPIGSHQLVQDLLVKCLGAITACLAMCMQVSRMLDAGEQRDEHSALAKAYVSSRAREAVAWAREAMGGNGIVLDYGTAKPFADAEAIYSFEGTREMNTLIVGRAITGHAAFV